MEVGDCQKLFCSVGQKYFLLGIHIIIQLCTKLLKYMLAWLTDNSGTQCSKFFGISTLQWSWLKIYSSGVRIEYPMYTRWGVHYWRPGAVVPWRWQGSDRWAAGDWQAQVCVRGSSLLHLSQHNIGIQDQEQEQERNNHSTKALLHLTGPYVGIQNSRSRRLKSVEVH